MSSQSYSQTSAVIWSGYVKLMTHKGRVKIHYEQMFDGVTAETIAAQFWQNSDIMTTRGSDLGVSLLFLLSEEQ